MACICADGMALEPTLIYQSDASLVQESWIADVNPENHSAFVTASLTGWSNDEIALGWLKKVFDRQTKAKAR
jgi:hypothetical protein